MSFVSLMKYSGRKSTQQIVTFGGIRYSRGGSDGEFSESTNLSARQFPSLSQRGGRRLEKTYSSATALYSKNGKLLVIDGTDVLFDGKKVGTVIPGEKMICAVNSKIVIFPDKEYYDTELEKFGTMDVKLTVAYQNVEWGTNTLRISGSGDLSKLFSVGQGIEISGSSISANNKTAVIRGVSKDTLTFSDNTFSERRESGTINVERKIPDLVCICESANRLWGAEGKTIWASAQGDPLTFYNYDGLATDSFAVAVGTDGDFTGCISYSSNVLFFKENALHKVLGTMPSDYRVYDYTVPGVQEGSQKSMEVINEILFYKGVAGIYSFSGSAPALISDNFGTRRFKNARAGTDGTIYYICMQEETQEGDGAWDLYTFDPSSGIWLREDSSHILDFTRQDTDLYALASDGAVYKLDDVAEDDLYWEAVFYPFDETLYGKRGYSKLWAKLELSQGAWMKAEISQDGGPFRQVGLWSNRNRETVLATMFPGRCDTFQLKLSGKGRCVIKSLVREFLVNSTK